MVQIGRTDLNVNPIGLGTNAVGGQKYYPNMTDEAGRELLVTASEVGVNFWDTAFTYGPRRYEQFIGEILSETKKRNDIVFATKGSPRCVDGKVMHNTRP